MIIVMVTILPLHCIISKQRTYSSAESNHGKPVYRKDPKGPKDLIIRCLGIG